MFTCNTKQCLQKRLQVSPPKRSIKNKTFKLHFLTYKLKPRPVLKFLQLTIFSMNFWEVIVDLWPAHYIFWFLVFGLSRTAKIIFFVCLLTHFARQDRQNRNLKNKQNHTTEVTKIWKNEVMKMTWAQQYSTKYQFTNLISIST